MIRDASIADLPAVAALYGHEVVGGNRLVRDGSAVPRGDDPPLRGCAPTRPAVAGGGDRRNVRGLCLSVSVPTTPRLSLWRGRTIYVDDAARGRGVGRALLTALIERARAMGLRHIMGAISDSNSSEASIRLHHALGFRDAGVYRQVGWKFDRWLDVTLVQLDLSPDGDPPRTPGLDLTGGLA